MEALPKFSHWLTKSSLPSGRKFLGGWDRPQAWSRGPEDTNGRYRKLLWRVALSGKSRDLARMRLRGELNEHNRHFYQYLAIRAEEEFTMLTRPLPIQRYFHELEDLLSRFWNAPAPISELLKQEVFRLFSSNLSLRRAIQGLENVLILKDRAHAGTGILTPYVALHKAGIRRRHQLKEHYKSEKNPGLLFQRLYTPPNALQIDPSLISTERPSGRVGYTMLLNETREELVIVDKYPRLWPYRSLNYRYRRLENALQGIRKQTYLATSFSTPWSHTPAILEFRTWWRKKFQTAIDEWAGDHTQTEGYSSPLHNLFIDLYHITEYKDKHFPHLITDGAIQYGRTSYLKMRLEQQNSLAWLGGIPYHEHQKRMTETFGKATLIELGFAKKGKQTSDKENRNNKGKNRLRIIKIPVKIEQTSDKGNGNKKRR